MKANVHPVPAPVGGWNARDSKDKMPEHHAVILDNWFPGEGEVVLRKGFTEHATGLGGDVETLAEFHSGGTQKFIAAANNNIWDITSVGAGSSLASSFTNNRWSWVNFNGSMSLVNGSDAPQEYDGATVSALTISGSGLTVSTLIGNHVHKSRTYYWADNSQDFWYSAVNAIGGTLTKFPLSRISKLGGELMAMASWSRDAGDGQDDVACFIMSSGEILIYTGSDPGSDYVLVGIFRSGAPIGRRCVEKVGGEVIIITKDGFTPISDMIASGRIKNKSKVSDQINGAVVSAAKSYGTAYGWQAILYPLGNMLIFNIPITTNITYYQYVFNTITGAPCRFKGMDARCWGLYNDKLYFGGSTKVYLADNGANDNTADIQGDAQTAFNYLSNRQRQKLLTAIQPVMSSEGALPIAVSVAADFATPSINYTASLFSGAGTQWDTAQWDTFDWGGGDGTIINEWLSAGGMGYNFTARIRVSVSSQVVKWYSTNYMYKLGGLV